MAKKNSDIGLWIGIILGVVFVLNGIMKDDTASKKDFDTSPIITADVYSGTASDNPRRTYAQLAADEKELYESVLDVVSSGGSRVEVSGIRRDSDELTDFVDSSVQGVYHDYPEFFWFDNGRWRASYTKDTESGTYNITIDLVYYDYWNYVSDPDTYISKFTRAANSIVSQASLQSSTYDKVKYIHDYLVKNVMYDRVCASELNQTTQRASSEQSHSAYGAIVNGLAVCDGYAKSFQLLTNMLGIECEFIRGYAGEYHAWNYIKLDGDVYWMDVTWDDSNLVDDNGTLKYPDGVEYDYFCITSEQLALTHDPDELFYVPDCTATNYNYFFMEGMYFDTYDFNIYHSTVEKAKKQQIISVKFASLDELKRAADDLFETNNRWTSIPFYTQHSIAYSADELRNILSVYVK